MGDYKITDIELVDNGNVDKREVHVTLDNGTIVKICACYESWEQYNATTDELYTTVDVAEYYNDWLHGDEEPEPFEDKHPELLEGYEDDDEFDEITREDVVEFIKDEGLNLFGDFVDDVAEALADEVLDEYNEAQDGDLQKAVRYVVLDKFGALE